VPIAGLLSKRYADSQRARIDAKRAAVSEGERHTRERLPQQITEGHPAKFADEHTTHFRVRRRRGHRRVGPRRRSRAVRLRRRDPGHRLVLNNILKWMDLDPASPNAVRAGRKRGR